MKMSIDNRCHARKFPCLKKAGSEVEVNQQFIFSQGDDLDLNFRVQCFDYKSNM